MLPRKKTKQAAKSRSSGITGRASKAHRRPSLAYRRLLLIRDIRADAASLTLKYAKALRTIISIEDRVATLLGQIRSGA